MGSQKKNWNTLAMTSIYTCYKGLALASQIVLTVL